MLDDGPLCSSCGALLVAASCSNTTSTPGRYPLCPRCLADPRKRRKRKAAREANRAQLARERAWKAGAVGRYTAADVVAIRRRQRNRCAYCGADLRKTGDVVDHLMPISRGGRSDAANIHLTCPGCNSEKGARTHYEYLASKKR